MPVDDDAIDASSQFTHFDILTVDLASLLIDSPNFHCPVATGYEAQISKIHSVNGDRVTCYFRTGERTCQYNR